MQQSANSLGWKLRSRLVGVASRLLAVPCVPVDPSRPVDHKWHQDFVLHLANVLRPRTYLELGIFHCGLFNKMIPYAGDLIGVDLNPAAGEFMEKSGKARFVCASTDAYAEELQASPRTFDMIFIDADHSKEAVAADFRNFLPFLNMHGLLLLHDTHPIDAAATDRARCDDGYKAIEALSRESQDWEMITVPVHPGLTMCRKRTVQLKWQEPGA